MEDTALTATTGRNRPDIEYSTIFWLFMAGSMLGVLIEGLWYMVRHGGWETHVVTIWGPFCVIYGFGFAGGYVASRLLEGRKWYVRFLAFGLAGSLVELICGLVLEKHLGMRAWDYSGTFLNIHGLVNATMTIAWGCIGIVFDYLVPWIDLFMSKLRGRGWNIAVWVLTVYMCINAIWTVVILNRWSDRHHGIKPKNSIARNIDRIYPDERLKERYVEWYFIDDMD